LKKRLQIFNSVPRPVESTARYATKGEISVSKKSNVGRIISLLFVFAACVVLADADWVVSSASGLPQNANSSTTQEDETTRGGMMTTNKNTGEAAPATTPRRRRRRPRRPAAAAPTVETTPEAAAEMSMPMAQSGSGGTRETAADAAEKADLSGTYTGMVNYPEGGMTGNATLTITGDQFTLTPEGGGNAASGTITAVTTRGYTGATMMFGSRGSISPTQNPPPPPLPAVSVRAKKTGERIWLKNVTGEKREFSFSSAGGGGRRRRGMSH
jgi:hypothetical protein